MDRHQTLSRNTQEGTFVETSIDIKPRSGFSGTGTFPSLTTPYKNMQEKEQQHQQAIRFVILGVPYSIRPSDDLSEDDILELIEYVKGLVNSYSQKGFDEQKIPLLVAFHIADELRRLQASYETPLYRLVEKLHIAIEDAE